jgi:hypothetical protein
MYEWINVPLNSAWTAGRIWFIFGVQECFFYGLVTEEYENSSSKFMGLLDLPKTKNDFFFSKMNKTIFIKFR